MYPDITQTYYFDNTGALGTLDNFRRYFNLFKKNVLDRGYCSNTTKNILIVHPNNIEAGGLFDASHGFRVCTGLLLDFIELVSTRMVVVSLTVVYYCCLDPLTRIYRFRAKMVYIDPYVA